MTEDNTTTGGNVVQLHSRRAGVDTTDIPPATIQGARLALAATLGNISSKKHCRRTNRATLAALRRTATNHGRGDHVTPEQIEITHAAIAWIKAGCEVCGRCDMAVFQ